MSEERSEVSAAGGQVKFRMRGEGEISRIEGFSDAVFAFAVTLLVISLEVPRSFNELAGLMHGFVPFAVSFAVLVWIWYQQYVYFRRYALQDELSIVLNSMLLFVVLFYIYPLKFLFTLLYSEVTRSGMTFVNSRGVVEPIIEGHQGAQLMMTYGAGFLAVSAVFAAMYGHAWRRRAELQLSAAEEFDTRVSIEEAALRIFIAIISIGFAASALPAGPSLAGWTYMLIGIIATIHGSIRGAQRRRRFVA